MDTRLSRMNMVPKAILKVVSSLKICCRTRFFPPFTISNKHNLSFVSKRKIYKYQVHFYEIIHASKSNTVHTTVNLMVYSLPLFPPISAFRVCCQPPQLHTESIPPQNLECNVQQCILSNGVILDGFGDFKLTHPFRLKIKGCETLLFHKDHYFFIISKSLQYVTCIQFSFNLYPILSYFVSYCILLLRLQYSYEPNWEWIIN